ncbi:hypothetical protein CERZMDRAFT_44499 [Cercospora zeae-maydis SCOH1-5]|uniref:GED domain-containing protein n=1 Tax=Cercospora zeae-maydis SCOH1-5 TaxID=717836 RepID=A0A6A6FCB5_9PEZI|nr:hypothetical protein CERZMDRAFT_44499 [Cercospora zeae-maydis SCOH1-5]
MTDTAAATTEDPLYLFGRKGRELIQAVQKLQSLGIDTTLPSLPKVVVIGDQSAGKSSIIEAISDITLPRSEGTCTRCPFRITTHASEEGASEWSCTISLQCEYYYPSGAAKGQSEFEGWAKYPQMDIFQVGFSPNVICLEITAPNLLELSFYDLPGAINVMHDEAEDYLSEFVETLLKLYLNDDQALVVIACPANQDVETGTAMKYLRKCKAAHRAIGVLTKPDLVDITPTRLASFHRMFSGSGFRLDGGWFMTKQLSQRQLNSACRPTYEDARAQEADFFSQDPWATELAVFQDRFGVANFQKAVAKKHIQHILDSLPTIERRLQERLDEVESELQKYPEKATQPGLEIMADIREVVVAVEAKCSAETKASPFRGNQKRNIKHLMNQLRAAAPKVEFTTPGYEKPAYLINDSDEMDETPSKRSRLEDGRASSDAMSCFSNLVQQALDKFEALATKMLDDCVLESIPHRQGTTLFEEVSSILRALFVKLFEKEVECLHHVICCLVHRPTTKAGDWWSEHKDAQQAKLLQGREEQRVLEYFETLESRGIKVSSTIEERKKKAADASWVKAHISSAQYTRELKELAVPLTFFDLASGQLVDTVTRNIEFLIYQIENRVRTELEHGLKPHDPERAAMLLAEDPQREAKRSELEGERKRLEQALDELKVLSTTDA